jgi:uncharacterized damage-inducible protein DinB
MTTTTLTSTTAPSTTEASTTEAGPETNAASAARNAAPATGERAELLATLAQSRFFLRFTARGLTDQQATQRTTASALTVGGLIKHLVEGETQWLDFVLRGPAALAASPETYASHFQLGDETLASVLDRYEAVARRTEEIIAGLPDLDADHPLPEAPWFPPNARWSARRVLLHLIAETAQHAGHADIIRESLDGAKTMG